MTATPRATTCSARSSGSEGTLGVACEITLRVIPAPEAIRTLLAFFADTGSAGDAVTAIVDAGIVPGAIEMMDQLSIEAAEQATGAGYRLDAGAALLVEVDGPAEECEPLVAELTAMCEDGRRVRGAHGRRRSRTRS